VSSWLPIGPGFVFTARNGSYLRLSSRNELARQGMVGCIAVDPADSQIIYTTEGPNGPPAGARAFRTDDGGGSWSPIADDLIRQDPAGAAPSCVAVYPALPGTPPLSIGRVYLGTYSGQVYVSPSKGAAWLAPFNIGGQVLKIVADPRAVADPSTAIVYAASTSGIWRSSDGGATFTQVLTGDISDFATRFPADGTSADLFAGVSSTGVFYATDQTATGPWANLQSIPGTVLPQGNFDDMRIGVCVQSRRVYVWFFYQDATQALFTGDPAAFTSSPDTAWAQVQLPAKTTPQPAYNLYVATFAVAPSSPGDGASDVLLFGGVKLSRSTDAGRTWTDFGQASGRDAFHDDYHALAFDPADGTMPVTYIGCDGGIGRSALLADGSATLSATPGDTGEVDPYVSPQATAAVENLGHAKQSTLTWYYGADPNIGALSYIACHDSGAIGGTGLTWSSLPGGNGDCDAIAAVQGPDGVKVWTDIGWGYQSWMYTDHGDETSSRTPVTLPDGSTVEKTGYLSNFVIDAYGNCLAGVLWHVPGTTLQAAVAAGEQMAYPDSMTGIEVGTGLTVDTSQAQETMTVTGIVTDGSGPAGFTATFAQPHAAGVAVVVLNKFLCRIDQQGNAVRLGDVNLGAVDVTIWTVSPVNPDLVLMAADDQSLRITTNATSDPVTWTQPITAGQPPLRPSGSQAGIAAIAVDYDDNIFVLLDHEVSTGPGGLEGMGAITSPLFLISGSSSGYSWVHLGCTGAPSAAGDQQFRKLVVDPLEPGTMYAAYGGQVYRLTFSAPTGMVTWTDISDGLPGNWVADLWAGDIGTAAESKALLRAAVGMGGIWELDVTTGPAVTQPGLYLRDNFLDTGWLARSPAGVANPLNPADQLHHYQCADIKIDAQQRGASGAVFFQTDPEGAVPPLSYVLFDELKDNSDHLPGADSAMVHVRVNNRGLATTGGTQVWALFCNASAGVPALNASPSLQNNFDFWSIFPSSGEIVSQLLPADSPWQQVGPPQTLPPGIDPAHPRVASWSWTVPTLPSGDPGHYCVVAFVHSAANPLHESSYDVDGFVGGNRQVGQKNVHIGPPLPPDPNGSPGGGPGAAPAGGGPVGGGASAAQTMSEYIEFHNPTSAPRPATFVLDLRTLPPEFRVSFVLTPLTTTTGLPSAITGIHAPGAGRRPGLVSELERWLDLIGHDWRHRAGELLQCAGAWLERLGRELEGLPPHRHRRGGWPRFGSTVYSALPSARVEIPDVQLPPFGTAAALFWLTNTGTLPAGRRYTFHVQQLVGGQITGGSAYTVRIAGEPERPQYPEPEVY
jgi:hypothetical protein